jgi:hypothetical protein
MPLDLAIIDDFKFECCKLPNLVPEKDLLTAFLEADREALMDSSLLICFTRLMVSTHIIIFCSE